MKLTLHEIAKVVMLKMMSLPLTKLSLIAVRLQRATLAAFKGARDVHDLSKQLPTGALATFTEKG